MLQANQIAHIYNPANQTKEELIANFVIRLKEFNKIFNDIRQSTMQKPEQHYLIQAQRGNGKTTLLLRLAYAIEDDPELADRLIPVVLNEEEYSIYDLCGLWETVIGHLESKGTSFANLAQQLDRLSEQNDYAEIIFPLLEKAIKESGKKLVIFVDNIGDILKKLEEVDQHRFREILLTSNQLRIIGGSSVALESTFDYTKPFLEFFRMVRLEGLTSDETFAFLRQLGQTYKQDRIEKIIQTEPGRIEALRRITGGTPRTLALLFEIFADENGDAFGNLEVLLDRVTPLYKHRMDDLPPRQQAITTAIALNWDGMTAGEIAKKVRMESKVVSAQLTQLEKNHIVEKRPINKKNNVYQLKERFFNIWFLMRLGSKRGKERVQWLVRFLQAWCTPDDLRQRAIRHLDAIKNGSVQAPYACYFTEALRHAGLDGEMQEQLVAETRKYLNDKNPSLVDSLSPSDFELIERANHFVDLEDYTLALQYLQGVTDDRENLFLALGGLNFLLSKYKEAENYLLRIPEEMGFLKHRVLGHVYLKQGLFESAEKHYLKAIEAGNIGAATQLAAVYRAQNHHEKEEKYLLMAAKSGDTNAMQNLAWFYIGHGKQMEDAINFATEAYKNENLPAQLHVLAVAMLWANHFAQSFQYFQEWLHSCRIEEGADDAIFYILLLLAKHQYQLAKQLFESPAHNLKEHLKVVWYALAHLLKDELPGELERMGSELEETVKETLKEVENMRTKYG